MKGQKITPKRFEDFSELMELKTQKRFKDFSELIKLETQKKV